MTSSDDQKKLFESAKITIHTDLVNIVIGSVAFLWILIFNCYVGWLVCRLHFQAPIGALDYKWLPSRKSRIKYDINRKIFSAHIHDRPTWNVSSWGKEVAIKRSVHVHPLRSNRIRIHDFSSPDPDPGSRHLFRENFPSILIRNCCLFNFWRSLVLTLKFSSNK